MRSVSGEIVSTKSASLSKAANILSKFVNTDNGASQAVSSYLRRASTAFNELDQFHNHPKASSNSNLKHKKHISNGEDPIKFDVGILENSYEIEEYNKNPIEIEQKGIEDQEDSLRKRDKKKKKIEDLERKVEGSLGSKRKDIPVEEVEERMTERKEKKKKRKSREVGEDDIGNSAEQSGSKKKKKRRRIEGDD